LLLSSRTADIRRIPRPTTTNYGRYCRLSQANCRFRSGLLKPSYRASRSPQLSNVLVGRGLVCGGRVPGPRSKVARPRFHAAAPRLHARTASLDLTRATPPAVHVAEPGLFARGITSGADAAYIPATAYRPADSRCELSSRPARRIRRHRKEGRRDHRRAGPNARWG
jgi:hypothetical protein